MGYHVLERKSLGSEIFLYTYFEYLKETEPNKDIYSWDRKLRYFIAFGKKKKKIFLSFSNFGFYFVLSQFSLNRPLRTREYGIVRTIRASSF